MWRHPHDMLWSLFKAEELNSQSFIVFQSFRHLKVCIWSIPTAFICLHRLHDPVANRRSWQTGASDLIWSLLPAIVLMQNHWCKTAKIVRPPSLFLWGAVDAMHLACGTNLRVLQQLFHCTRASMFLFCKMWFLFLFESGGWPSRVNVLKMIAAAPRLPWTHWRVYLLWRLVLWKRGKAKHFEILWGMRENDGGRPRLYSKHEGGNMEMERNGLAKVVENQLRHAGDGACVAACFVWDQRYPSFDHLLRNGRMLKTWGATCLCLLHGILVSTLPGPCCFCWTFSKWPNPFMSTSHDQNTTDFRPRYNAALGGLLWFLNSKVFSFLHVHTSFWFIHNLSQFSIFQSVQRCSKPLYRVTSFGPGYQLQIWRTFLEDGQVLGTPCSVHCTSNFCICSILNLDMYSLSSLVTCQSCQSCQPCQPCQCCQPCQSCHFLLNNFCVYLSVGRPVLASL